MTIPNHAIHPAKSFIATGHGRKIGKVIRKKLRQGERCTRTNLSLLPGNTANLTRKHGRAK
jgi:hypothetical protein